jgi:Epoxide hydrolase N terminus
LGSPEQRGSSVPALRTELVMSSASETAIDIRPFQVEIPEGKLAELRRRIEATRWPSQELVADRSQGVQLATLQELARYWTTEYDWRRCETRLNTLPQFTTEIDGVDIHFIHVKSPHENALPLIMTHGWPGSVIELLETVGPLTDPTATAQTPRTRSTWCCRPCPATASPASRPRSAGTSAAPRAPGPSS